MGLKVSPTNRKQKEKLTGTSERYRGWLANQTVDEYLTYDSSSQGYPLTPSFPYSKLTQKEGNL
jgi:hypothetical protein